MQTFAQPFIHFQGRSTTPKTPAHIPVRPQTRFERPSGLPFDDVRIHYASGREQQTGHTVPKGQDPASVQLQAMPGQDMVQLRNATLQSTNYIGADKTTLGREARRKTRANRNQAKRRNRGMYSHSDILKTSLEDAMALGPAPNDITNQAHHIVETSNVYGQQLLRWYGIHPDSAINGVLLPTYETDDTGNTSVHLGRHSAAYTKGINAALEKAVADAQAAAPRGLQRWLEGRKAVIRTLMHIRDVLLTENVPLNKHSDANYNPVTGSEETIADIFSRTGLT